ncbi:MAG: PilZ domain-containing protein [Acidobacteriota bacterium]|jgi:CheY-like chemotaxis protein
MSPASRRVLVVGKVGRPLETLIPVLRRTEFSVHHSEGLEEALQRQSEESFDLVVARVGEGDAGIEALIQRLRATQSASRRAGLLLLAEPDQLEHARSFLGRGVNRVVAVDSRPEEVLHGVADLVGAPPRLAVRTLAQLSVRVGLERQLSLYQTENLSALGMLLRGDAELPVGTRFDFELSLPGDPLAVVGAAQVVWHTDPQRHGFSGFGVRFLSFRGADGARLRAFLERHLQRRPTAPPA